jgi:hypothetical protein
VPCTICFVWKCNGCGALNPVGLGWLKCHTCGKLKKLTKRELEAVVHKPTLVYCPRLREGRICNRKLRAGPRDKVRHDRLKI